MAFKVARVNTGKTAVLISTHDTRAAAETACGTAANNQEGLGKGPNFVYTVTKRSAGEYAVSLQAPYGEVAVFKVQES
jgi:hypothetical protein